MNKHKNIIKLDVTPDLVYIHKNPLVRAIFHMRLHTALQLSKKSGVALDFGCGDGYFLPYIEDKYTVIGADISKGRLKRAKNKTRAFLCLADATKLPFRDEAIDVIFCLDILEHINELDLSLMELSRVLKKNGELIISMPTENTLYKIGKKIAGTFSIEHVHHLDEIIKGIRLKFRIVEQKGVPFVFPIHRLNLFIIIKAVKR